MCGGYYPRIINKLATDTHGHTQTTKPFCLGDLPRQNPHAFQATVRIHSRSDGSFWLHRLAAAKPFAKTGRGVNPAMAGLCPSVCVERSRLGGRAGGKNVRIQMVEMIELHKFDESDIPRLISWILDARFLLQFAGPGYTFPLDSTQLMATLEKSKGDRPSHFMFKAQLMPDKSVVGHIELMAVDYEKKSTRLGRVLIGEAQLRGKGYGTAMIAEAISFAFTEVDLAEVTLAVFDFNRSAIASYKKLGFREYEFRPHARQIGDESWNLMMMKLDRKQWLLQRGNLNR
jgi:RimJ/RimL family protein N-acetyltransferase